MIKSNFQGSTYDYLELCNNKKYINKIKLNKIKLQLTFKLGLNIK